MTVSLSRERLRGVLVRLSETIVRHGPCRRTAKVAEERCLFPYKFKIRETRPLVAGTQWPRVPGRDANTSLFITSKSLCLRAEPSTVYRVDEGRWGRW